MELIRDLLKCLQFPKSEDIDISKKNDLVTLVCWLEDRKIRQLEVSERDGLRTGNEQWDSAFSSYLESVGCPFSWENDSLLDCISWLVSHAVAVEFEDIADATKDIESNEMAVENEQETDSEELTAKVDELGELVGLSRGASEDNPEYLQRISRTIRLFYSKSANDTHQHSFINKYADPLKVFPLGFDTGDEIVNKIAIVVKMLHLYEYRELQNDLNALIVLGQEYTANPRTNNGLGRVGK